MKVSKTNILINQLNFHKKNSIIVESEQDIKLLKMAFGNDYTYYCFDNKRDEFNSNKEKVIESIKKINEKKLDYKVVGLVDRDYDAEQKISNLVYYDCNDLESTLLKYESYDKIIKFYIIDINNKKIIDTIFFDVVSNIGKIRNISQRDGLFIDFKINYELSIKNFYLDIDDYLERLLYNKNGTDYDLIDRIKNEVQNTIVKDEWQFCRGHDCSNFLTMIIGKHSFMKNDQISDKRMEDMIIIAFEKEWLQKTNFYSNLKQLMLK